MTLRQKILLYILALLFLVIVAMSGTYYYFFVEQVKDYSRSQVGMAFELMFNDLDTRMQDFTEKIDQFMHSSLSGTLYMVQLLQEQYKDSVETWTAREVRKIMTPLGTLTNETRKFGELIDALEILIYDQEQNLLAAYQHQEEKLSGVYLPSIVEEGQLITVQPGDDWYAMMTNLEDIPQHALLNTVPTSYQGNIPEKETVVTLNILHNRLVIQFVSPILQREVLEGLLVVNVAITQKDVERYSRLSKTRVNVFAGETFSVGALPEHQAFPNLPGQQRQMLDFRDLPDSPKFDFIEMEIDENDYYQGTIVFGNEERLLGAVTAHFHRALEEERVHAFVLLVMAITVIFAIFATGGASVLSSFLVRPITNLTQVIHQLAQGDFTGLEKYAAESGKQPAGSGSEETPAPQTKDELLLLFKAFHTMVDYLRDMAIVAERISRGQIAQDITPRSANDVLGNAFHRMTGYLKTIATAATAVAEGDLRHDITPQNDQDVLGQAFHRMKLLREAMSRIMDEALQLRNASDDLTHISAQMATDSQQASGRVQDVSSNSEQVSENVGEIATATREMAANIREISRHADGVAQVVSTAVNTAKSAGKTMENLETRSEEIGKIIKLITTITQQTNLLALNATIEAARAGDSGKGFAVVASEVKDLAREIAVSAEDITHKVEAIQASSQDAAAAIGEMAENIKQVQEFTDIIVASVTEQTTTTDVITRNLSEAAHSSEEVSQAISDVSNVTQNSSQLATGVQRSAKNQMTVAEKLQQMVSAFKI